MVALSESVKKNRVERSLAEKWWWRHIRLAIKHCYLGNRASQTKNYYGTLSRSHGRFFRIRHKNRLKRFLAEDWRWRHIRLAIKPHYLANHASQIKCYYGTLSWNHGRSFKIRNGKLPQTPPGGEITMASYPACNKTLFSRKPCIEDKTLLWNAITKSWSLFQNPVMKNGVEPPGGEITMTSYPACNKTSLSRKPRIADKKLLWITIMKYWSLSNFYKKQQILILKTCQFKNVVIDVSRSLKTAYIRFSFDSVA